MLPPPLRKSWEPWPLRERHHGAPELATLASRAVHRRSSRSPSGRYLKSARCPGRTLRILGTHPVEARSSVKITLHRSGLRPPLFPSPRTPDGAMRNQTFVTITSRKTSMKAGKAPRQGISSSRVKADCRTMRVVSSENRMRSVGTLWNSEIVVDCGGKPDGNSGIRIESARFSAPKNKGRDLSRPPIRQYGNSKIRKCLVSLVLRRERPVASASATGVAACVEPSPRFAGYVRE